VLNVKVLYFASARDLASTSAETLAVPEGSSVGRLASTIYRLHPALGKQKSSLKFSVNLDVVGAGRSLHEGDEVGVLPPVAGG
jgi:molybdopterin converting factor subunit 1